MTAKYEERGKRWGCTLDDHYGGNWYVAYGIGKTKNKAWRKARRDLSKQLKAARKANKAK
jgi:hypothetical protein